MNFNCISCYIVSLLFILNSCGNRQSNSENLSADRATKQNYWSFDSLVFKERIGVHPDSLGSGVYLDLFIEYPVSAPDSIDLKKIQFNLSNAFLGGDSVNIFPNDAFKLKTEEYIDDALENLDEWNEWSMERDTIQGFVQSSENDQYIESVKTRIDSIIGNIMIVSTSNYSYLGGAHGSYYIIYKNIHVADGLVINEKNLFVNNYKDILAEIIQQKIIQKNKSANSADHIQLLVDIDEVRPNDNFYFTRDGLMYVYNQYEIAPYARGMVEILLPYKDILPLVKYKYLVVIENLINNTGMKTK